MHDRLVSVTLVQSASLRYELTSHKFMNFRPLVAKKIETIAHRHSHIKTISYEYVHMSKYVNVHHTHILNIHAMSQKLHLIWSHHLVLQVE